MATPNEHLSPDTTLADLATRHPGAIPVLEGLGLDYCCGGQRPLGVAAAALVLDWTQVRAYVEAAIETAPASRVSWSEATLSELIAHILDRFHAALRVNLPLLALMGEQVVAAHGERHPEVREVASVFAGLRAELDAHMMEEEHVLFPFVEQLELGLGHQHPMLGHIASPIGVKEREHEGAGALLVTLRRLTSGYAVPADACATFRGYYDLLAKVERDLHQHIHLENNVLFPRVVGLETRVMRA